MVFIGDVHSHIKEYLAVLEHLNGETSLQVGDMGVGFQGTHLPKLDSRHKFIRGNHDGPAACRLHPNYLGDVGYIAEKDLFYAGGGFSVDGELRKEHTRMAMEAGCEIEIWWPDEEMSPTELVWVETLYELAKPRIVVTHECPTSVQDLLLGPLLLSLPERKQNFGDNRTSPYSRTAVTLEKLLAIHRPELWVFGHYHTNWERNIAGTRFVCLAELATLEVKEI